MSDEDEEVYPTVSVDPTWVLVREDDSIVASIRAETATEAREIFKQNGQVGVRVKRAEIAPSVPSAGAVCEFCGNAISMDRDYRLVTGWERLSRNGAGGTHAIRVPNRTAERYACMFCVDKLAAGVSPFQQALM